uniref:Conserved oligomeric Golgi complex subunit 1 n=1 Tax=Pholiota microspora TaxID=1538424 RepID=B9A1R6_PHOMI|nr:hypothetical protein UP8 [Pholiota nameko]
MVVLSPTHSARSVLSPKSTGYIPLGKTLNTPTVSSAVSATYAKSLFTAKLPSEVLNLGPDELFTKYTVSEVKAVQHQLRRAYYAFEYADAKQEELRLMVGERYRDLLQASSSIISIAKSAQHVLDALEESREAIISQHDPPLPPKTASIDGLDDRHLVALQVLSAHMKLLLDAPEHLWRLIERKKYLQAAWLFLLSRVESMFWFVRSIYQIICFPNIVFQTEFPLVQRQWDVVSQFRSQIIHKSTLSLREASASSEETCATLVTLHLLDSRPLNETLATLLLQRSKTLQSVLAWNSGTSVSKQAKTPSITIGNGDGNPVLSAKPVSVREVTQTMKRALSIVVQTVITARAVFQDEPSQESLIVRVLRSMQEDQQENTRLVDALPEQLYLTTQSLLSHLTSSANFQLLPVNLRSYKPYVDLNSSSSLLNRTELSQRVEEWYKSSCDQWRHSAAQWFSELHSIKEVWSLRNAIRRYVVGTALLQGESAYIVSNLDSLCHERILGIWQNLLLETEAKFKKSLHDDVSLCQQKENTKGTYNLKQSTLPILNIPHSKNTNSHSNDNCAS